MTFPCVDDNIGPYSYHSEQIMGRSIHHPVGLIYGTLGESYAGYTLITNNGGDHATLLDMEGRICHRWLSDEGIGYAYLLPNGNLLCRTSKVADVELVNGLGGSSKALLELDWDGNVVWEYRNDMLHHDFERLPNGNTLVLLWQTIPSEVASRVRGGYTNEDTPKEMLGDVVSEITPDGEVVYEWRSWQSLDTEVDVICPLEQRREWTHCNNLNVTPNGDFLVSFRLIDVIGRVNKDKGEFSWKWGRGEVSHQHHVTHLENGNVMLFDNGTHRRGQPYSRIIEFNPDLREAVWEYTASPDVTFYSHNISSAERLPNGNTLICEGAHGRIFEVRHSKEVVWEYINPFFFPDSRSGGTTNATFRAHRYGPDHPALQGKDLDPGRYASHNLLYARR